MAILVNDLRQFLPFLSYCGVFVGRSCSNNPPRYLIIMRKCLAILPDVFKIVFYWFTGIASNGDLKSSIIISRIC